MGSQAEFSYSTVDLFDGREDTLEELEKLLKAKVLSLSWSKVKMAWFGEGDDEGRYDKVIDAIDWLLACGRNQFYDLETDWMVCPYSDWQGSPFKLLVTGGMSTGDACSDAQMTMWQLYASVLPLTASEEVVLAYRVRRRRGVPCSSP